MSLWSWLSGTGKAEPVGSTGILSPWAEPGSLGQIVISEIFGVDPAAAAISREGAVQVSAVYKARNLLIATIANTPLVALRGSTPLADQPSWLYRTDGLVTPLARMSWTVDDLVFYGNSLWTVERGTEGQILNASYLPRRFWKIQNGRVLVNDKPIDETEILYFDSAFEGLLKVGQKTLTEAFNIEAQVAQKVTSPIPLTVIRHQDGTDGQLDQTDIDDLLGQWDTARRSDRGAFGYLPAGLTIDTHGESDPALFDSERNAVTIRFGQYLHIPAYMLDASLESSFTYNTAEGTRDRFYAESLPFWTAPIEARLSQDDCVPRGSRVAFDFTDQYAPAPTPTGAEKED